MPHCDPPKEHQFKPGQSGNPKGRPKGRGITDRIRAILNKDDGEVSEALAKAATEAALKGDFRFWKEIIDRVDGKVPDEVKSDGEVIVHVKYDKPQQPDDEQDDQPDTA